MGWFFKGLPSGKRVAPIYPMETPNGVRSTVGGRFIPSGLLLAQDFTHEPACQTGERAPQGRFRHQPEQMVHPPFAWQLASFPSQPVCGEEAPFCPLRNFVTLRTYSLEIKARQALSVFLSVYPELAALIGWNVPNYQGVFLRGYGGQTSYHYGAVGHWSAGLGELQGDGIREISASFSTGGAARNRRSIRELWSHRRTGVRLEIWGNRKHLLGWDRFLCFSRYSGCW